MPATDIAPSSATRGFFQDVPVVPPQYVSARAPLSTHPCDDHILTRILNLYLPRPIPALVDNHLHEVASQCLSEEVQRWTVDAELNVPTLHSLTTFGQPNETTALRTGEGWRELKKFSTQYGAVALGYSTPDVKPARWNRRIHHMAMNHIWTGSAALVTCSAAMTDGTAILLGRHLHDADGDQPDPSYAWTSGQRMTERSGGSDVSQTETTATRLDKGGLAADAERFCAIDADMVVMLARTSKANGLSAFFAPMKRRRGSSLAMNGVRIIRLKNKLGTKALPASELEIVGMRGWLLGEEDNGVREIASILSMTRIWTACGAIGGLAQGLAVARAYSRVRKVQSGLLQDNLQHVAWIPEEMMKYRSATHVAFLGMALSGLVERGEAAIEDTLAVSCLPSEVIEVESLLRLLIPVMKAQCSLAAVNGLRACMESLGGVGYCKNNDDGGVLNVARIFRDTNVNAIWEGTTSVMAEDVVRVLGVLKGKSGHQAIASLDALVRRLLRISRSNFDQECGVILVAWSRLKQDIEAADAPKLHYGARRLLGGLENMLCSLLLMADAASDLDPISVAVVSRWMQAKYPHQLSGSQSGWQDQAAIDQRIFLGTRTTTTQVSKANL